MPISHSKKFWGKHFWFIIHYFSLKLSRERFLFLLKLLGGLLPCAECRSHLRSNIEVISRLPGDAFELSCSLHSLVNEQLQVKAGYNPGKIKAYYVQNGSVLIDREVIFVLRVIAHKYDGHLPELKEFLSMASDLVSDHLKRVIKNTPVTPEYETQSDLIYWSIRLGINYSVLKGETPQTEDSIRTFFREGLSDDCNECNLD